MDKFERKEMIRKRPFAKNTWCDWLTNYIPQPIRRTVGDAKEKNACEQCL